MNASAKTTPGLLAWPALILAAAVLPAPSSPAAAAATQAAPSAAERRRLEVFDQVWTEIRDDYYDPALNGVDWAAVRARYRPRAASVADDEAFHDLLRSMVGELRDAHTRILGPRQARDRRENQTVSAGAILFEVDGRPVVFDVRPGSPADEAGLRPGMEVLSVDGVPVGEALARARAEVGASSSERAATILAYSRLAGGPADEALRLGLVRLDGTRWEVALPRRPLDSAPRFEARLLPSGHLYVRFDRFRAPVARLFREALLRHPDAPGLILDLRSNTGGDGREGMRVVAPLLDRRTLIARLATRDGRRPSAMLGLFRLPLQLHAGGEAAQLYGGPVAVLVNQGTASTSEVIAASLQERGRARIVGATSCGCALGVLRYRRLATGGALAISEIGLLTGLGRRIEGEGVSPDLPVPLSLADLREGRDPALEAAVRLLAAASGR